MMNQSFVRGRGIDWWNVQNEAGIDAQHGAKSLQGDGTERSFIAHRGLELGRNK
jgi:hypothetical protein